MNKVIQDLENGKIATITPSTNINLFMLFSSKNLTLSFKNIRVSKNFPPSERKRIIKSLNSYYQRAKSYYFRSWIIDYDSAHEMMEFYEKCGILNPFVVYQESGYGPAKEKHLTQIRDEITKVE